MERTPRSDHHVDGRHTCRRGRDEPSSGAITLVGKAAHALSDAGFGRCERLVTDSEVTVDELHVTQVEIAHVGEVDRRIVHAALLDSPLQRKELTMLPMNLRCRSQGRILQESASGGRAHAELTQRRRCIELLLILRELQSSERPAEHGGGLEAPREIDALGRHAMR